MTKDYANMLSSNGPDWQRAADEEWLAAIRKRDEECNGPWVLNVHKAPHECSGCADLRALLKRATERGALP